MDNVDGSQMASQAPGQSHLNRETNTRRHTRRNQFVKPGSMDAHYDVSKELDAIALPQEAPRPARLNPFALPSDTDLHFIVLIISVLASSLLVYSLLSNFALINLLKASSQCILDHKEAILAATHPKNPQLMDAAELAVWRCQTLFLLPHGLFQIAGMVLILGVATVTYWLIPLWKLRRGKLVPLSIKDMPELVTYLSYLCNEAKLTPVPCIVWNPLKFTCSPQVFGRLGRYHIALTGGLVILFSTNQTAFRAIMLHELAHLRNRDVNKTYFAIAIWWTFVAVALFPLVIALLLRYAPLDIYQIWCILALTVLIHLTLNGVLRTREIYADVRASTWENSPEALIGVLQSLLPSHRWWQTLIHAHPSPQKRLQLLHETHRLFRVNLWVIFSVGIALGIAFPNIEEFLNALFVLLIPVGIYNTFWLTGITFLKLAAFGTALIVASLLVGTVGVDIWRAAFAAFVENRPQSGINRISLCLGGGLILGTFLSLSLENSVAKFSITDFPELLISSLSWILLLLISLMLFLRWIAAGAAVWLEVAIRQRSPHLIYRTGLVIAGVVLTVDLTQLFLVRTYSFVLINAGGWAAFLPPFAFFLINTIWDPVSLLALVSLWAFPLSAWFWHKEAATASQPNWAFLDASPNLRSNEQFSAMETQSSPVKAFHAERSQFMQPGSVDDRYTALENVDTLANSMRSVPPDADWYLSLRLGLRNQGSIRLSFVLVTALIGGFIFCSLLIVIRIWVHWNISKEIRNTDQFTAILYGSEIALAVLIQTGIAGIAATKVRQLGGLNGLFTAFVAGIVMTIGYVGINLLSGGGSSLFWLTLYNMVNGGAFLELPIALIVPAIVRRMCKMSSYGSTTPS